MTFGPFFYFDVTRKSMNTLDFWSYITIVCLLYLESQCSCILSIDNTYSVLFMWWKTERQVDSYYLLFSEVEKLPLPLVLVNNSYVYHTVSSWHMCFFSSSFVGVLNLLGI